MLRIVGTSRGRRLPHPRGWRPLPYARGPDSERSQRRTRGQLRRHRQATTTATKRLDIQGLRALAVLLVALNHANVSFVSGGYVGVDVFFVVSGYLITGILLRAGFGQDGGAPGRISIRGFYERRVRRILPAASLTLVVASIAVFVVYDLARADFLQTGPVLRDGLAASLFYSNLRFAATATNYFAQASTTMPSPFQHFWSLSVEEQFYLVWAPVVACALYVCRRLTRGGSSGSQGEEKFRRAATRVIGLLIASACVLSLAWSIHDTSANPQAAYFSTPARVWELGCGATLALLVEPTRALPEILRALLGWIGLAMIVAAALFYSSQTSFPGYAALLPVVGAGLIIVAGMTRTPAGVHRVLSAGPLPYIGDRSYAFYLWHFPALILVWQATGRVLPVGINLVLLTGAFMLAAFTYRLFENPLRFARWLRGRRISAMVAVALTMSVAAALVPIVIFEGSLAAQAATSATARVVALTPAPGQPDPTSLWGSAPIPAVAAAAKAARRDAPLPKAIVPSPQELEQENATGGGIVPASCEPALGSGVTAKICRLGDPSSARVVVVLGDSQAGTWMPAMVAVARAQHLAVVPLDKPGCFVSRVYTNLPGWPCASWYQWALARDKALHPVATIVMFLLDTPEQHLVPTVRYVKSVLSQVRNGVLLVDHPRQVQEPTECIYQSGANMGRCSTRVPSTYVPLMKALGRMTALTHHPAIPTLQWFCADGICPMVIGDTLATRDRDHMTKQYSTALAPLLSLELTPILARPKLASLAPASEGWASVVAAVDG